MKMAYISEIDFSDMPMGTWKDCLSLLDDNSRGLKKVEAADLIMFSYATYGSISSHSVG